MAGKCFVEVLRLAYEEYLAPVNYEGDELVNTGRAGGKDIQIGYRISMRIRPFYQQS